METINTFRDLEKYGIVPLTGESCGIGRRILCDVTKRGRQLIIDTLGLPDDCQFRESWNRGDDACPHVGSIMLSHCMVREIAVFALIGKYDNVIVTDRSVFGTVRKLQQIETADGWQWQIEYHNRWCDWPMSYGTIEATYRGTSNLRNQHGMSGRVE